MTERLEDDYVVPAVCSECPFRKGGLSAVRLKSFSADRIADDVRSDKPFPCHKTTHPVGLGDHLPRACRSEWRFCAGAFLAMSPEERAANLALRLATGANLHNPDTPPTGAKLVFNSLDEFLRYYNS